MRYYKYKGVKITKKEQKNFICKANRAVDSLYEVESFLHGIEKVFKYVHLYKFLK